ncbi:carbamate kinase [Spiroplasma mirum ATCC 29335]|uniref:Carbamate kinase n=1 Tax=Spiroplasma mirum ATCC 29335 TaxID=838561 RepID=W0GPU3_9MOLU|nr:MULTISPECIES: carbamate kinase [Spiroplasma]AHF60634.1 carbamate kinase [Spiroplasma mirum ATCC 29335]AHI57584.1 carbamate kinase [Spiroplasma mirum ATCC 29335]AKM52780.1 carbamate kinase [Spiroplasma atrichopogonis]
MSRIVVALGGNALGNSRDEQHEIVKVTAKAMVDIIVDGKELVITHGNGPQVGIINNAFAQASKVNSKIPMMPFPECGAMSQAYIGYHLQNAILNELNKRNIKKNVVTIVTQVEVAANDKAFENPTKPIGSFYTEQEAKDLASKNGFTVKEDAGRGWRRVIASPQPVDIVEKDIIKDLIKQGHVVITVGGGGIPVVKGKDGYQGVDAVIDKDFASAKLAELVDADQLMILTAVPKVAINYGKPNQTTLDTLTISEAEKYIGENQFAPGSMLPKVQAAMKFAQLDAKKLAVIAELSLAKDALNGKSGTTIKLK